MADECFGHPRLAAIHGRLDVEDLRDAPDRPGREFVFVARRPGERRSRRL